MKTTTYRYRAAAGQAYPEAFGNSVLFNSDYLSARNRPQDQRVIHQQDVDFTWQADAAASAFDGFARPLNATKFSSLGYSYAQSTNYHDNWNKWVIGQTASIVESGLAKEQTDFDPTTAVPTARYQFGRLVESITYSASGDGTVYQRLDPVGRATTFTNYWRGVPMRIVQRDGSVLAADVNNIGRITSYTNAAGTTTQYGYDSMGRLASIVYPAEPGGPYFPTTISFEPVGQSEYGIPPGHWRQTISTGNARTVRYFDALWRVGLSRTFDAANEWATASVVETHYDPDGRKVFQSQPQRSIDPIGSGVPGTSWFYDGLGRVSLQRQDSELGPLDTHTAYWSGFQRHVTDPRGFQSSQGFQVFDEPTEERLAWDVREISQGTGEYAFLAIGRDIFGKPTAITRSGAWGGSGPASVTRSYTYDAYQRLCKTVEPESGATVQGYDAASNVAWRATGLSAGNGCDSTPGNRTISYGHDAMDRLTNTSYGDGSPGITRSYAPDGLLSEIKSVSVTNTITWTYNYNNRRLLTNERYQWGDPYNWWDFSWGVDANGHVSSLSDPWGAMGYAPNAHGQPTQVSGYVSNVIYHPNGTVNSYLLNNGITHYVGLNARGLPQWWNDPGVINDEYSYDASGNVSSITDYQQGGFTSRSMPWYDGLDRLRQVNGPWGVGRFDYDALDNMRRSTVGGRDLWHNYDDANRLVSVTGSQNIGYGYDANGNRNNRGGQPFNFDIGNRMSNAPGFVNSYLYDGNGRRNLVFFAAADYMHQAYTQDGKLRFAWRLSQGARRHVYLGPTLIAETDQSQNTTFMHTDALGSPVATSGANGSVINRTHYEPYGKSWAGTNPPRIGFTGHVNDADTGLVYMQQRYYDPIAARFLSVDPVVTDWDSGSSFNRYVYAQNNPYRYTDPDGRNPVVMAAAAACARSGACVTAVAATVAAAGQAIAKGADAIGQAISRILNQSDSGSGPQGGEVQQAPGNKPPFTGEPGSTVQGGTGSRTYGPDGYPKTDRDSPHPDEKGPGSGDHAHDWGRPKDGGPPTHNDRGPARDPKKDDPPPPRGPNTPPKEK